VLPSPEVTQGHGIGVLQHLDSHSGAKIHRLVHHTKLTLTNLGKNTTAAAPTAAAAAAPTAAARLNNSE
jgi:hypothetical protein